MGCKAQTAAIACYCEDLQRRRPPDSTDERGAMGCAGHPHFDRACQRARRGLIVRASGMNSRARVL